MASGGPPRWLPGLLILMAACPAWAAKIQALVIYQSSVSRDTAGPLDLRAELNYNTARLHAPIAVVMHGYSPTACFGDVRPNAVRLRDAGFFAVSVAMRGRESSDGVRDSGGVEIHDIYDAVEYVKSHYPQYANPGNVHITGYSGGGGNVMSALVRFPDYFRLGSSFFGMSDYGASPTDGWYFRGAASSHKAQMRADIGDPENGGPPIADRYLARASCLASHNTTSEVHLFVNQDETICPPVNHARYRDNAVAHAQGSNVTVHVGGTGQYVDFNANGINEASELQSWPHGFPTENQQKAAESWYLARLLSGAIPQPTLRPSGTLRVAGFVRTTPFSLWLGDGHNAAGDLEYGLSSARKEFRLNVVSSNSATAGTLTVETADMVGQPITVVMNGRCEGTLTGGSRYVRDGFRSGDTLVLATLESGDCDGNGVLDACQIADGDSADCDQNGIPDSCEHPRGDLDCSGTVDTTDIEAFIGCASGASVAHRDGCGFADLDRDGDADQSDFGALQRCIGFGATHSNVRCAD